MCQTESALVEQWGRTPLHYQASQESFSLSSTSKEKINKYLLRVLKQQIPYFLNVHRSKTNLGNNQIIFGAGRADLSYVFSMEKGFIKFRMDSDRNAELFYLAKEAITKSVDYELICFGEKEVVFLLPDMLNPQDKAEFAAKVFNSVVDTVIPITYKR